MTIPTEVAQHLNDEAVGAMLLAHLDTTEGDVRLVFGEDGKFTDTNGNAWYGSKLLTIGDIEDSLNGKAPSWELTCSYTVDPDIGDLVEIVRSYGVDAIDGRPCRLYFQYFGKHEEMYAPIHAPILITRRIMRKLTYTIDGPQTRSVTVTCEGPYPLRSKPVNGRYTDGDQRRRTGGDPSLEFMPYQAWDDEPLFGA